MNALSSLADLAWMAAGGATCFSIFLVFRTVALQRGRAQNQSRNADVWLNTFEAAQRLADDMSTSHDREVLRKHLGRRKSRESAIGAVIAVLRGLTGEPSGPLTEAIDRSGLGSHLKSEFVADDPHRRAAALEIAEAARLRDLVGDVANLVLDPEPDVVRAAANALVVLKPDLAVGVLVGLIKTHGSWVVDSLGRAANALATADDRHLPIARPHWRDAPNLAERALSDGRLSEPGDASDAVAIMIGLLNDEDSGKRLGAVNALANVIDHPGAQIALAGAIGVEDRVTRFAAAVRMADSEKGRALLKNAAESGHSSDAAEVAALVLWGEEDTTGTAT